MAYNFIDLFAGCGGLSEGFYQENFHALLHLEIDKNACKTLATRMKYYNYTDKETENAVLCADITSDNILDEIDARVKDNVDIIIGGPPCQAFSFAGRAQDPNSMSEDPRNYLFENYLKVLNHIKPKLFIFENVKGLLSAHPKGVKIFDLIIKDMSKTYKIESDRSTILLNAVNYGVPQMRERVILIGVRNDINIEPKEIYNRIKKTHYSPAEEDESLKKFRTVRDAISDLPSLQPGEGANVIEFEESNPNEYVKLLRQPNFKYLYNHVARRHNKLDRARYRILSEHQNWKLKDLAKVRPDLVNHDPQHFVNRYTVQQWDLPGRTVVAHLYKDGNLFIHPDPQQARTFTVREAARVQSFPDNFVFEGSRTDQYKQVGNAVPPLMSRAFAKAMKETLDFIEKERL